MDIPPAKAKRHHQPSPVVLPDELIAEILSFLSVKTLMRLRTVSKAWKTLISNPTFVNVHLKRSPPNANLTLLWAEHPRKVYMNAHDFVIALVPFPIPRLLENPSITITADDTYCYGLSRNEKYWIAGSCNGLVCFYGCAFIDDYSEYWLGFGNLAMRTRSEKLGHFRYFENPLSGSFKFSFGYDNSTGTHKVVAFRVDGEEEEEDAEDALWRSEVKVFNLGDNFWRKIESFPVAPLSCLDVRFSGPNDGVHLSGTINWLALRNTFRSSYDWKHITHVEQFVIVLLSLSTETYTQLLLPKGFKEVPRVHPTLRVLMNCLCFSHDFRGTEFVIWQMKEFGVRESWTQLIRISYETLQMENLPMHDNIDYEMYHLRLLPLYLSENSDTLILANDDETDRAIIYNWRNDRVERTRFRNTGDYYSEIFWFSTMDYVESLVSTT